MNVGKNPPREMRYPWGYRRVTILRWGRGAGQANVALCPTRTYYTNTRLHHSRITRVSHWLLIRTFNMPASPPETRASLILRLQDPDDVAAWDEFVRLYSPVVYRVSICRGFQPADADNIVQDVMLSVARSVSSWLERSDRGSFRAWLLSIARNQAFDLINARATRSLGSDGSVAQEQLAQLAARSDLTSTLDLEHARAVFQWAAEQVRDTVAEHTWQGFWLTKVEGLSVPEAAEKLKIRPGNIYFARSRVMARIKQVVEQYKGNECLTNDGRGDQKQAEQNGRGPTTTGVKTCAGQPSAE